MADLQDGWLVFESGREKRRLEAPYPADWITMPIHELQELCRRASLVVRRRASTNSGQRRAVSAAEIERVAARDEGAGVTFHSPLGREWTVNMHDCIDANGNSSVVLRFASGNMIAELANFPADWRTATMKDFALMLLDAEPPVRRRTGLGPQRRREDRSE
jgi:hypothetical protein